MHIFSIFWKFSIASGRAEENANLDTVLVLKIKVFLLLMIIKHESRGFGVLVFQLREEVLRNGFTIACLRSVSDDHLNLIVFLHRIFQYMY
jgi:hypothetical protein